MSTPEIIVYWLLTGIILDAALIFYIREPFCPTWIETAKDTPWWAHAIMIAFPPAVLLALTELGE